MVIRMRHTKGHTANRRSHHALTAPKYAVDKETGSTNLRHRVDLSNGMYRGKKIIDLTGPEAKKTVAPKAKKTAKKK